MFLDEIQIFKLSTFEHIDCRRRRRKKIVLIKMAGHPLCIWLSASKVSKYWPEGWRGVSCAKGASQHLFWQPTCETRAQYGKAFGFFWDVPLHAPFGFQWVLLLLVFIYFYFFLHQTFLSQNSTTKPFISQNWAPTQSVLKLSLRSNGHFTCHQFKLK